MDTVAQLRSQWFDYTHYLRRERFLDDQFAQLKKLQDASSPDFVFEVVSLFFQNSEKVINIMAEALEQNVVDFNQVVIYVHRLKGSSACAILQMMSLEKFCLSFETWIAYIRLVYRIGATRVKNACIDFRNYCEAKDIEG
uniref:histidine-containing phosphotransfer protein 2-like n=1 Tax=Fragaria vesca subsp. vesca TaxID=101020 RepID=UPI0005CA5D62|nr:PREDICTED: histidine-containing phosphotransfer protein 2-like [Fragaria vesca subsp. vesca]